MTHYTCRATTAAANSYIKIFSRQHSEVLLLVVATQQRLECLSVLRCNPCSENGRLHPIDSVANCETHLALPGVSPWGVEAISCSAGTPAHPCHLSYTQVLPSRVHCCTTTFLCEEFDGLSLHLVCSSGRIIDDNSGVKYKSSKASCVAPGKTEPTSLTNHLTTTLVTQILLRQCHIIS